MRKQTSPPESPKRRSRHSGSLPRQGGPKVSSRPITEQHSPGCYERSESGCNWSCRHVIDQAEVIKLCSTTLSWGSALSHVDHPCNGASSRCLALCQLRERLRVPDTANPPSRH